MTDFIHKEFPKTCAPDDFFGQVKRTVNGKPVSQEQIDMILSAIRNALNMQPSDVLLDLGCGNGALAQYLFTECSQYLGVDFSEYLIEVAKQNFEQQPTHVFRLGDVSEYVRDEPTPHSFTKAMCYGVFPYIAPENAELLLENLSSRFSEIQTVFIGNLPDRELAHQFFHDKKSIETKLDERDSPIGIWRSTDFMVDLANRTGWKAEISTMPKSFYASHYRFDVTLRRVS